MTREIKFRAWDIKYNEFVYGSLIQIGEKYFIYKDGEHGDIYDDYFVCSCTEIDKNTIGEFTGLYDMNDKQIFEGDILKWDYKENNGCLEVVEWDYELFDGRTSDWPQFCEVIGNIYENKELLGDKYE